MSVIVIKDVIHKFEKKKKNSFLDVVPDGGWHTIAAAEASRHSLNATISICSTGTGHFSVNYAYDFIGNY